MPCPGDMLGPDTRAGGGGSLKKGFVRVFNDKANKKITTGTPLMIHR